MSTVYARLINQHKFSYPILFSAIFYRINEENQRSDEIELFINLIFNNNKQKMILVRLTLNLI